MQKSITKDNSKIKNKIKIGIGEMLLIFCLAICLLFCLCLTSNAFYLQQINYHEEKMLENDMHIEQYDEIKKQLHSLAKLLRDNKEVNKDDLDILLSTKWHEVNNAQIALGEENAESQKKISEIKEKINFIGYFTITYYSIDSCGKSPSDKGYGITATGTYATPGRTIAVDKNTIPFGTTVIIDGHPYIAEDTGGAIKGNKIDICVASNAEAIKKGVRYNVPVYIKKSQDK